MQRLPGCYVSCLSLFAVRLMKAPTLQSEFSRSMLLDAAWNWVTWKHACEHDRGIHSWFTVAHIQKFGEMSKLTDLPEKWGILIHILHSSRHTIKVEVINFANSKFTTNTMRFLNTLTTFYRFVSGIPLNDNRIAHKDTDFVGRGLCAVQYVCTST